MIQLFRIGDFFGRPHVDRPAERIERALLDRARRLMIGLSVDAEFRAVSGVLVVARGRGHATRVQFADGVTEELSASLRESCVSVAADESRSVEFSSCVSELAEVQANVVERLKSRAAKYVDRILAVSVVDPGWWKQDFDNATCYSSFCDAAKLAERSGISVIDAWPSRDLSVGGDGRSLAPLAWWLLCADRNERIARHVNVVINFQQQTTVLMVPPSDGLDIDSPKISAGQFGGTRLIEGLCDTTDAASADLFFEKLNGIAGRQEFQQLNADQRTGFVLKLICDQCAGFVEQSLITMRQQYAQQRLRLHQQIESSPKLRVAKRGLLDAFDRSEPEFDKPGMIVLEAPTSVRKSFVPLMQESFTDTKIASATDSSCGFATPDGSAFTKECMIAAMMGFLHVDQMPGNLPQFTGATQQRILGRLTPGRPNSWRNLLKEMADFEPPSIRLRDAV